MTCAFEQMVIRQPWTSEDVRQLLELREKGLSIAQCAKAMGRSKDSVTSRLRNPRQTQMQPWTAAERATLRIMLDRGAGLRECSVALGRTYFSCRNQARAGRNRATITHAPVVEARALGLGRHRDGEYAALCMAQGGFWAYSERRGPRGRAVVCAPLLPPQVSQ